MMGIDWSAGAGVTFNYPLDVILSDLLIGVPAMSLIIVAAISLGGFSFFTPWMIVTPPILFIAGGNSGAKRRRPLAEGPCDQRSFPYHCFAARELCNGRVYHAFPGLALRHWVVDSAA